MLLLGLVGVLLFLLRKPIEQQDSAAGESDPDIDQQELSEAEEEVRDLDASISPSDADEELPDWGPGVPKPR